MFLATIETEGKSPRTVSFLKTRLRYFNIYIQEVYGQDFKLQELTIADGRNYIGVLMKREKRYQYHPIRSVEDGKLKLQYIHGLGWAVRSFSTWAFEEGYLEENVMRRL